MAHTDAPDRDDVHVPSDDSVAKVTVTPLEGGSQDFYIEEGEEVVVRSDEPVAVKTEVLKNTDWTVPPERAGSRPGHTIGWSGEKVGFLCLETGRYTESEEWLDLEECPFCGGEVP